MSKKHEKATIENTDWAFASDPEVLEAVDRAVRRARSSFPLAEAGDCTQEAYMWLSVRKPRLDAAKARAVGDSFVRHIARDVYKDCILPFLKQDEARQFRQVPWSEWEADE